MRNMLRLVALASICTACSVSASEEAAESDSADLVKDISSMRDDGTGTFTVRCRDGHVEYAVTADRVQADDVCSTTPFDSAWFDPASCSGPELTRKSALEVGQFDVIAGKTTARFGIASHVGRVRDCNTNGTCGSWRTSTAQPALVLRDVTTGTPRDKAVFVVPVGRSTADALFDAEVRLEVAQDRVWIHHSGTIATAEYEAKRLGWSRTALGSDATLELVGSSARTIAPEAAIYTYYKGSLLMSLDDALQNRESVPVFSGKVTATCARWSAHDRRQLKDSAGNSFARESELVVFVTR